MEVLVSARGTGRRHVLGHPMDVYRRRMTVEVVMVPSRGPVVVGLQGAPMSDLVSDHRRALEALIDGPEDYHFRGHVGWLVPMPSPTHSS
jgi:hypothetical protein